MEFTFVGAGPGPFDRSLLHRQEYHVSEAIWSGATGHDIPTRVRTGIQLFREARDLIADDPRVLQILHRVGLYGVHRVGHKQIDHALITALSERWRRETHTFHFRSGEATVTLQDMAVLSHLPLDGEVLVTDTKLGNPAQWAAFTGPLLGFELGGEHLARNDNGLKVGILLDVLRDKVGAPQFAEISQIEVEQVARLYMMVIINHLFCTTTGDTMDITYLVFIADLSITHPRYSWCSAVLAHLYRALCDLSEHGISHRGRGSCGGPMLYLQVWAWMRLPMFTPRIARDQRRASRSVGPIVTDDGIILPSAPAAARYTQFMLSFALVVRNNLLTSREQLDTQDREAFIWQPYRQDDTGATTVDVRYCT